MLSANTWPNHRCGSDKDAVRIIVEEKGFKDDVEYGKTKLFVRHPHTILGLEEARTKNLHNICITVQKVVYHIVCFVLCDMKPGLFYNSIIILKSFIFLL